MGYNRPRHGRSTLGQRASVSARSVFVGGAATTAAAAAVLGAPAFAAHAAATTATADTAMFARPDSGFAGDTWASDNLQRIATVTLAGPDSTLSDCGAGATACFTYNGTINDNGSAFAITGATSPGAQGVPIKGAPVVTARGGTLVQFHASSDTPDATLVPKKLNGAGTAEQSTTNWVEQFFPAGTTFGTGPVLSGWSWTYRDTGNCQTWLDAINVAQADSGDITGVDSCTTSVAPVPPQTVTVGTAYSLQVQGSTTSSDRVLKYTASGLPDGLSINAATGLISGTPATDAAGGNAVVTVTDFGGVSAPPLTIAYTVQQPVTPPPPPPPPVTVVLSHGHVVAGTLTVSRAEVTWTATPEAAAYQVVINGPGFDHRTAVVSTNKAFYRGLHGGHGYTVFITPLGADRKPDGATGRVFFRTPTQ